MTTFAWKVAILKRLGNDNNDLSTEEDRVNARVAARKYHAEAGREQNHADLLEAKLLRDKVEDVWRIYPTALLVRAQMLEELDEHGVGVFTRDDMKAAGLVAHPLVAHTGMPSNGELQPALHAAP